MYDRKTWIVLALCGGLLVAHFHFAAEQNRAKAADKANAKPETAETTNPETFLDKATPATGATLTVDTPPPPTEAKEIILKNKEVSFTLSNIGGGIKSAVFLNEFEVGSTEALVKSNRYGTGPIGALTDSDERPVNVAYSYKEDESIEDKKVVYIAKLPSGLIAKKTYSLIESDKPGAPYLIDFKLQLENTSAAPIQLSDWSIFLGEASPLYLSEVPQQTGFFWRENGKVHFKDGSAFKGGMGGLKSEKLIINSDSEDQVQFAGVTNQFFATVLQPLEPTPASIWGKTSLVELVKNHKPVSSVYAGLRLPAKTLAPNENQSFNYRIFIGPKHNNLLRKMEDHWGQGWGDVMQYGWFWFVSRPLNFLLNFYHNLIGSISAAWSWGLAIILLTITVRIFIWPLHAKSTRTMKRMSKLKPEMDKLKEKYADDPNKLNTETMGLYRKYGINPLGGCLPMLIQIPVFFGFYRMLQYAVELRGQGFLWVDDLSQPDTMGHIAGIPINLLPVVMAISSFLQLKMTPTTGDKMQQRIMLFMPLIFFFFCYNFASALALYWTTQNIFSIGQTWLMSRMPEPELKASAAGHKKTWVQRMAERQAEMQKTKKQAGGSMRDVTPDKKKRPPRTGG